MGEHPATSGSSGRFAPSPTGRLHLGNLRTALLAWLFARSGGGTFLLRFEDLDDEVARPEHERAQRDDLLALGLDWDGQPFRQRDRLDRYRAAVEQLVAEELAYPCYCSRREIREAAQAPHGSGRPLPYPGTCRTLDRAGRRRRERAGRPAALRFRGRERSVGFTDTLVGPFETVLDDFVIQRGDGTPAYNLAAPIDDAETGIELVVRADDLVDSTPRQLAVLQALGLPAPSYAHVPLVVNDRGERLAKRDGAVTLTDRLALGQSALEVRSVLAASLGLADPGERPGLDELLARFEPAALPRDPWVFLP